jgi:acetylornithine/succinyldiaminopimelate/putrescine aminotransferase
MDELAQFKEILAQTSPSPMGLSIKYAQGSYIFDTNDRAFLDFTSGIAVSSLGHGHPRIKEAIKAQVDKHLHVMVYGEFMQEAQTKLGKKLIELLPDDLSQVYFVNSGTEANEGALKLAKRFTNRTEIISFDKSYHGSTHGSLSVSGNEDKKYAFRPLLPDVKFIPFNCQSSLEAITQRTACVIVETIQGDAGIRIPSRAFMQALRKKCDLTGALLVLDEIQCGMGRTGKMFAFEHFGITPDILTIGKAFGGGMPIGAFVSSTEIMGKLSSDPILGHITTFGGHPLPCSAALAALQVMEEECIADQVEEKGAALESMLQHREVKEIRRVGLFMAVDLSSAEKVQHVVDYCKDHGVLSFWFLSCPNSFRIAPPLNISTEDLKKGALVIQKAFDSL